MTTPTDQLGILVVAPEAGYAGVIRAMGSTLVQAGFVFRSASIIIGSPQFVDHIYSGGPTRATDRVSTIPSGFLSYAEYAGEPSAIVLLDHRDGKTTAQRELNRLKGSSRRSGGPERGTLRAVAPLCGPMYSFVHVPDVDVVRSVQQWGTLPVERLTYPPCNTDRLWSDLEHVLSPLDPSILSFETLRRQLIVRWLEILLLSQLDVICAAIREAGYGDWIDSPQDSTKNLAQPELEFVDQLLAQLAGFLPLNCCAGRRLLLVIAAARWLLEPSAWTLTNIAESQALMRYAGLSVGFPHRQLLLSQMAFRRELGPE